jgi:2-isopropylmalate synthase
MKKYINYRYPDPIPLKNRQWPNNMIKKAPIWCSVDLRDGNQALPIPMNPAQKKEYFQMLTKAGFKEIEVSFPSASQDDFDFVRILIEEKLIPKDVKISVLTQARKHLIDKTIEALTGIEKGILHLYVAASDLHSQIVFNKTRKEVIQMAVDGTIMVVDALEKAGLRNKISYEFSPEEFTDCDLDYIIKMCERVKEAWQPKYKGDFIVNLPATVERRPPNHYADMVEYFCKNYKYRNETIISLHAHNDQGCAVAATELALLSGADRVEGTLFGHGERTGNVDIISSALNLQSRGINTGLNFSSLTKIKETVENISKINVHPRHPYAGELVFTAFSGSHQNAIRKGMLLKNKASEIFKTKWKVPYLHIDPSDAGKKYESLIRINSQSGKGGAAYVMEKDYGLRLPKVMHPELGALIQKIADKSGNEISSEEIYNLFNSNFVNIEKPYKFISAERLHNKELDKVSVKTIFKIDRELKNIDGTGNGPISAVVTALRKSNIFTEYLIEDYQEQSLGQGADATAIAFVRIKKKAGSKIVFGAGQHSNIDWAAIKALFSAINRIEK